MFDKLLPLTKVKPITNTPTLFKKEGLEFECLEDKIIMREFYVEENPDIEYFNSMEEASCEFIRRFVPRNRPEITQDELLKMMEGLSCQATYRRYAITFSPNIRGFASDDDMGYFEWSILDDGRSLLMNSEFFDIGGDVKELLRRTF